MLALWAGLLETAIAFLATERRRAWLFDVLRRVGAFAPGAYAFNVILLASHSLAQSRGCCWRAMPISLEGNPEGVFDFYIWHFLDAIPWLVLAFKVTVIVPVIAAFAAYWGRVSSVPDQEPKKVERGT